MEITFHSHAELELEERQISREMALQVVRAPQEKVPGHSGRWVYQSRFFDTVHSQEMLLRVVIEEREGQLLIVSIYKTSKIDKYWQEGPQGCA